MWKSDKTKIAPSARAKQISQTPWTRQASEEHQKWQGSGSDNDDSDEDNGDSKSSANENENDDIDSGDKDKLRVVILVFINDEEAVGKPAITHSGRTNNTIAINMPSVLTTSVH